MTLLGKPANVIADRARSHTTIDTAELLAIGSAALCLLHCLALPLAIVVVPLLVGIATVSEDLHFWLLALALPTSMTALLVGWRRHRRGDPPSLGAIGLCLLVVGIWPDQPRTVELSATITGSLFLVSAHLTNWRLRRVVHRAG